MAVSAFKSTSKRGNLAASSDSSDRVNNKDDLSKKIPPRRSRSVSAVSRTSSSSEISSWSSKVEFLNIRDNPLFCITSSHSDDSECENLGGIIQADEISARHVELVPKSRRGRSVSRSFDSQSKFSGRSLSRVDTGTRRRSVSRARYGSSEGEVEPEYGLSSSLRGKKIDNITINDQKKAIPKTNDSELYKGTRSSQRWSRRHPPSDGSASCMQGSNLEDGVSVSSYSEAEEKTIIAVSEERKVPMIYQLLFSNLSMVIIQMVILALVEYTKLYDQKYDVLFLRFKMTYKMHPIPDCGLGLKNNNQSSIGESRLKLLKTCW